MTATDAAAGGSQPDQPPALSDACPAGGDQRRPARIEADGATQMSVDTVELDAISAQVRVSGELDMGTSAPLWAVLDSHLRAGRRFVRLDMSGVTFLDATALTGIVSVHDRLLAARGTLVVNGVRDLVARVLRMTGLDEVLFVGGPRADRDTEHARDLSAALADQPDAGSPLHLV